MKVLVDSDCIIYPLGFYAASNGIGLEDTLDYLHKKEADLEALCERELGTCDLDYDVCVAEKTDINFRDRFHKHIAYKANRKKRALDPLWIDELKDEISLGEVGNIVICDSEDGEVDDFIAILATHYTDSKIPWVILGVDKDFNQIPGRRLNPTSRKTTEIQELEALQFLYEQIMAGDSADNVPGIPNIGPVKAKKALSACKTEKEMFDVALAGYVEVYGDNAEAAERMYECANLVYLRRSETDFWSPPDAS
jgi:hypothetical protein